jgi:hypothetical protein
VRKVLELIQLDRFANVLLLLRCKACSRLRSTPTSPSVTRTTKKNLSTLRKASGKGWKAADLKTSTVVLSEDVNGIWDIPNHTGCFVEDSRRGRMHRGNTSSFMLRVHFLTALAKGGMVLLGREPISVQPVRGGVGNDSQSAYLSAAIGSVLEENQEFVTERCPVPTPVCGK